jgi:hypothetical protein
MIKITKCNEAIEVSAITACLYAVPGVGKTSMGFTAEQPLLLDFDKGSYRAQNRKDVVQVAAWADVAGMTAADLAGYKTVVVDTAGRALDCLTADIIESNPKMGRGGALTLPGYGELKARFVAWTKLVRGFGKDVVLLCHSDEQRSREDLIERLDMQGASKGEVYKAADCMGRIYLQGGKRVLNFSPTDTAFGKNPAMLPPLMVPDYTEVPDFLGGVIAQIKASLNKLSTDGMAAAEAIEGVQKRIAEAVTMTDFDALLPVCREMPEAVRNNSKKLLLKAAKAKGFGYNKDTGAFDLAAS